MPWTSALHHLACARCGREHDADVEQHLCGCGGPLLARYDLDRVGATTSPDDVAGRPPTLWRYRELLPVRSAAHALGFGEGMTPLVATPTLGAAIGVPHLSVKDEGVLPTGSFKARGAAVGVARARELGARRIVLPTNGNAGAAWATYGARAGLRTLVTMPADAPAVPRTEIALSGAELVLVDGLIGDAGRVARERTAADPGWYDASTLKEPYRIEGKKTMGLEIAEQLGWRMPDVVVYPTGGGVGLIGIDKAVQELAALGWLDGPPPRFVSVQASGCAPIVRAFESGAAESEPWADGRTIAFGINVGKALGDFLVLDAVRRTGGTAVAVDDADTLAMVRRCYREEGLFVCPEGAAALAAVAQLRAAGWLGEQEHVLVLNTGTGLKYLDQVAPQVPAGP